MKRWILASVILIAAAIGLWYWQSGPSPVAAPQPGLACHVYTEPKKDVPQDLTIPVLKEKATLYKVLEVIDGDTIKVEGNGRKFNVRFLAVDTPEKSTTRYGHAEAYGEEASKYTEAKIRESGMQVYLTYDAKADKQDRYGRDLAYVWLKDKRLLNAMLVADGYAYLYSSSPQPEYTNKILALMRDARAHNRGLWSLCK